MSPGLELDILVAEKVMGFRDTDAGQYFSASAVPPYSTDIAAAWQVVEKLALQNIRIELMPTMAGYAVDFIKYDPTQEFTPWTEISNSYVEAEQAPHAICLAALKAVGVEV
jgi:hypothetical protein